MNESREELERLARRLCEVAGWEFLTLEDKWLVANMGGANIGLSTKEWLPLARVVEERDRLKKIIDSVRSLSFYEE